VQGENSQPPVQDHGLQRTGQAGQPEGDAGRKSPDGRRPARDALLLNFFLKDHDVDAIYIRYTILLLTCARFAAKLRFLFAVLKKKNAKINLSTIVAFSEKCLDQAVRSGASLLQYYY
jgi:hypothetical protein